MKSTKFADMAVVMDLPAALTLDQARIGQSYHVRAIAAPPGAPAWWTCALEEIGFIAGECVTLMARGVPGGDPLAVRVGGATFALRRAEAACVGIDIVSANAMP